MSNDLYLLAPEISMIVLALLVMTVDLFVKRRIVVAAVALVGLLVPTGFVIVQALERLHGPYGNTSRVLQHASS